MLNEGTGSTSDSIRDLEVTLITSRDMTAAWLAVWRGAHQPHPPQWDLACHRRAEDRFTHHLLVGRRVALAGLAGLSTCLRVQ